jgi:ABC-type transporter Mla maintaining outer membrane lipid asymmetry ATPase subunit MlaF
MKESGEPVIEMVRVDVPRAQAPSASAVVQSVDWRIEQGDFWAVGAYAGTGKTDLLCTAAALERPLSGTHLLFGKDTAQMREDELVEKRLKIAMVFSGGRLFSDLTVAENIALPLRYHGHTNMKTVGEKVAAALEMTGLTHLATQWPADITLNLHQRIALARALVLSPEVLLLDNPLGNVDARLGRWWLDFLCLLNKGGAGPPMTIVIATDNLRPWVDTASRFAVLKDKQLEAIGGRQEVRSSQNTIVRELLMQAFES